MVMSSSDTACFHLNVLHRAQPQLKSRHRKPRPHLFLANPHTVADDVITFICSNLCACAHKPEREWGGGPGGGSDGSAVHSLKLIVFIQELQL